MGNESLMSNIVCYRISKEISPFLNVALRERQHWWVFFFPWNVTNLYLRSWWILETGDCKQMLTEVEKAAGSRKCLIFCQRWLYVKEQMLSDAFLHSLSEMQVWVQSVTDKNLQKLILFTCLIICNLIVKGITKAELQTLFCEQTPDMVPWISTARIRDWNIGLQKKYVQFSS